MTALRYGIAGYGWLARDYADPALRALSNAHLVAAYDLEPTARAIARERGLVAYDDLDAFLAVVDAVYVATPNHVHREIVERAAAHGKHVLCEKPMATRADDGEAMLAACARADVAYATAYDQRYHPAHVRARELVRAGALGTVTAVRIVYACWLPPDWSADNWRVDVARSGGGALVDLAPHGLDLAATLLDDEIVDARAFGQHRVHDYAVDDGAMIVARTRGDALVQLHVAYNHSEALPRRRLEIVGTTGLLTANDTMGQTPGGTLTLATAATGETDATDATTATVATAATTDFASTTRTDTRVTSVAFDETASPFAEMVRCFTNDVLAGMRYDATNAARERAALATLESLLRDVEREAVACR